MPISGQPADLIGQEAVVKAAAGAAAVAAGLAAAGAAVAAAGLAATGALVGWTGAGRAGAGGAAVAVAAAGRAAAGAGVAAGLGPTGAAGGALAAPSPGGFGASALDSVGADVEAMPRSRANIACRSDGCDGSGELAITAYYLNRLPQWMQNLLPMELLLPQSVQTLRHALKGSAQCVQ